MLSDFFIRFCNQLSKDVLEAVRSILEEEDITWEQLPWKAQFAPVIIRSLPYHKNADAVNPAINGVSGLGGTSKIYLNSKISPSFRPKNTALLVSTGINCIKDAIQKHQIKYPVFFKPDIGERSTGVQFIASEKALEEIVLHKNKNYIIEEAIRATSEFCVSIKRNLTTQLFEVFSFTERVVPTIIGDGKRSVRKGIELLKITFVQKENIIQGLEDAFLASILPKDEEYEVVKTASIAFGTQYVNHLKSLSEAQKIKLENQVARALINTEGFNIGRFDIKANSVTDLLEGDFKIIELNAEGGMPTHVYEEGLTLDEKQKIIDDYFLMLINYADTIVREGYRSAGIIKNFKDMYVGAKNQERSVLQRQEENKYLKKLFRKTVQIRKKRLFS